MIVKSDMKHRMVLDFHFLDGPRGTIDHSRRVALTVLGRPLRLTHSNLPPSEIAYSYH